MRKLLYIFALLLSFPVLADFWKELNKVVNVIEELAAPVVSNLCFAESVENNKAIGISKSFSRNVRKIHVWFNINGASPDQTISAVWMKKNSGEYVKIYELSKQAPPQNLNCMDFSLAVPENSMWPVGEYKVDIIWNNKVLASGNFQITDAVRGGDGIWGGDSSQNLPYENNSEKVNTSVQNNIQQNDGILTEEDKQLLKGRDVRDIELMIAAKIHGLRSELGSCQYKYRNDPEKLKEIEKNYIQKINKVKLWGNAAMAFKGSPPKWSLDEDIDSSIEKTKSTPPSQEKSEKFDFNF